MDSNLLVILFYALFIWGITLYWKRYHKTHSGLLTTSVLSIYSVSAVFTIIYYLSPYNILITEVFFINIVYWLMIFLMALYPIFKYDNLRISHIKYDINLLNMICVIGLVLSLLPFLEYCSQLSLLFESKDLSAQIADMHDDITKRKVHNSFVAELCLRALNYLYYIIVLALVPVVTARKPKKIAMIGVFVVVVTKMLPAILISARPAQFANMLFVVVSVLLFYPTLATEQRQKIRKYFVFLFSFLIGGFMLITIARQIVYQEGNEDYTMIAFLSRYAGEGILNFGQYMFLDTQYYEGDQCFWYLKKLLFLEPFDGYNRDYLYAIGRRFAFPMNQFFTFIGSFVQDIGLWGTLFFFIFISFFMSMFAKAKNGVISFSSMYMMLIYVQIIAHGFLFYQYNFTTSEIFFPIIVGYVILRFLKI